MKAAIAQIAPVFLDRAATVERVAASIREAGDAGATLVCFGEVLVPGYPVWLDRAGGARFDNEQMKALHAVYLDQAVDIEAGDLDPVLRACAERGVATVLGVAERPRDRGGHSIFCSRVYVDANGRVGSVHRKLVPTYEERLEWAHGDGAGLVTHRLGDFTLGALNCWENWMPLPRAALQAQGMDLHVMIWPGRVFNTEWITRFAAREGRSYVVSASALLRETDIPDSVPHRELFVSAGETFHEGGSAVANPDGSWLIEPTADHEGLIVFEMDPAFVRRERQNFDPAGHYARPDVLRLTVDRRRHSALEESGE